MATNNFELMALSLLMCTPSDLNRAWTDEKADPNEIEKQIQSLGLSSPVANRAQELLEAINKTSARLFFGSVARTLAQMHPEYAGPGSHPCINDSRKIVEAMKQLDSQSFRKSS